MPSSSRLAASVASASCRVVFLTDMTPKATYQPSDEISQAIKGATLSWATEKDEKEGTETPAGGDDNGGDENGGDNGGGNGDTPGELEG